MNGNPVDTTQTDATRASDVQQTAAPIDSGRPPATTNAPGGYAGGASSVSGRAKSPALACFLSAMPGLGQVYVGYYKRGFIHALVVASLITLLATGDLDELTPLVSVFLAFFWLYNIIDAGRRATLYNQFVAGGQSPDIPPDFETPGIGGSIFGGLALIAGGLALLLHTRFDISLAWLEEWWPVVPIVFGVFLLIRALQEKTAESSAEK